MKCILNQFHICFSTVKSTTKVIKNTYFSGSKLSFALCSLSYRQRHCPCYGQYTLNLIRLIIWTLFEPGAPAGHAAQTQSYIRHCMSVVLDTFTAYTHTHTAVLRPFVWVYPGEPVPEETFIHSHPSCSSTILISFLHLLRIMASSLLNPRTWQSLCTTSNHVLFGLPLGLEPTTSNTIHFFTQSLSSFRNTCPYHRNLFCCSSDVMSTIPSLSLNSLFGTLSFNLTRN